MYEVVSNEELAPNVRRLVVRAERVAAARKPGQFVIVRAGEGLRDVAEIGRAHV